MSEQGAWRSESVAADSASAFPGVLGRKRPRRRIPLLRIAVDSVAFLDATVIILTSVIADFAYISGVLGRAPELSEAIGAALIAAGIAIIAFRRAGLYRPARVMGRANRSRDLLVCWTLALVGLLVVAFLTKSSASFSRGWAVLWYVLAAGGLVAGRILAERVIRKLADKGMLTRKVAIVGASMQTDRLVEGLLSHHPEIAIAGVFDDRRRARDGEKPKLRAGGTVDDLIRFGQKQDLDEIVITLPPQAGGRASIIADRLAVLPVDIRMCVAVPGLGEGVPDTEVLRDQLLLRTRRRPLGDWAYIVKVLEDRIMSFFFLVALAPVMLLIALAIKLDTKGPFFFRQRRHGFNHEVIWVMKFRTMTVLEDGDMVRQASKDDARVTRVGRFLRRTSLDELPQLINVLKGEMSLVGPRPHALAHNEAYSEIIDNYAFRHRVKPGITGWAQVHGLRGETSNESMMRDRVDYDLYYIENWSLWLDIKIMFRTLCVLPFQQNAY